MRVVFYGLTDLSILTANKFIEENHEVIIIEPDKEKVEKYSESMDCSFLVGDASYPNTLKETNPKDVDYFFALSENNQNNIVACLIARSFEIDNTFLRINDKEFESISRKLDLQNIIVPAEISSEYLYDAVFNANLLDLFSILKNKISLGSIVITKENEGSIEELGLDENIRAICYFRDDKFHHFDSSTQFTEGDRILLITDSKHHHSFPE